MAAVRALSASVGTWVNGGWETASSVVVARADNDGRTGGAVVVVAATVDVMGTEEEVEPGFDTRLLGRMLLRRE
jgi:hypothetical protein